MDAEVYKACKRLCKSMSEQTIINKYKVVSPNRCFVFWLNVELLWILHYDHPLNNMYELL